jgi:hypothetical protein
MSPTGPEPRRTRADNPAWANAWPSMDEEPFCFFADHPIFTQCLIAVGIGLGVCAGLWFVGYNISHSIT